MRAISPSEKSNATAPSIAMRLLLVRQWNNTGRPLRAAAVSARSPRSACPQTPRTSDVRSPESDRVPRLAGRMPLHRLDRIFDICSAQRGQPIPIGMAECAEVAFHQLAFARARFVRTALPSWARSSAWLVGLSSTNATRRVIASESAPPAQQSHGHGGRIQQRERLLLCRVSGSSDVVSQNDGKIRRLNQLDAFEHADRHHAKAMDSSSASSIERVSGSSSIDQNGRYHIG